MDFHPYYKNNRKRNYCQSVIDIPFPEESAKELERLLQDAERAGLGYRRLSLDSQIIKSNETHVKSADGESISPDSQTAILTASTLTLDGDGEVVVPAGINRKQLYEKNPIVGYAHNYTTLPPVGKSLWTRVEDAVLKAKVKFAKRPANYPPVEFFPELIFALVEQEIIKGVSIGFMPVAEFCGPPTTKEIAARPELAKCKAMIRRSVLTEISIVPAPCNPDALIESVTKGLVSRESLAFLGLTYQDQDDCWEWEANDMLPVMPAIKQATLSRLDLLKKAFPLQ